MLVSSQIRAMPTNFLPVPSHGLVVGTRGSPLAGTPRCRFSDYGTPGHYTASEPTSSLNTGECPPWQLPLNAHVACWRPGSLSEGRPCPVHCPRGIRRPEEHISWPNPGASAIALLYDQGEKQSHLVCVDLELRASSVAISIVRRNCAAVCGPWR